MSAGKIKGLIAWKDHAQRSGESYCLRYLHPFQFTYVMDASDKHPAISVIQVVFGLHTFTRSKVRCN